MKTRKITYNLLQVINGRVCGESAPSDSLSHTLIMARAISESGFSSLIFRRHLGFKDFVVSEHVVWALADMVSDFDVISAPYVFTLGVNLVPPSYVKPFVGASLVNAELVAA